VDIALVSVAISLEAEPVEQKIICARIALGGVAPTPIRADEAERAACECSNAEDFEAVATLAANSARPISDVRASASYRRRMVQVLVKRGLYIAARKTGLKW